MGNNKKIDLLRFLRFGKHSYIKDPGAHLFQGVRLRLTLWYCSVLAAVLVLFGTALYFGVQQVLLHATQNYLAVQAFERARQWQYDNILPSSAPPSKKHDSHPPDRNDARAMGSDADLMVTCFDQNNTLLDNGSETQKYPPSFLSNNLAQTAAQTGQPATDIVDGGSTGPIYRYALPVSGHDSRLIVQVGTPITVQENALQILLVLLLILGTLTLAGAGLGGLFLAHRALEPTRQAFTQQQRFIADASHELRTPLALLRADADVLLRGRKHLQEDDVALLEDIVSEVNHMATLTNRMLTLARLDGGVLHREHEVVHLDQVAREVVQRVKSFAAQKNITIEIKQQDAPSVIGDSMLLEQVVLALVDNAIKYNRTGGQVTVLTAVRDQQALVEVSDTGIGIAPEHLPHLGERFYRVDKARSREAGGTGLGLSIAHGIATAHGGTLTLTSILDQGTTATLLLPVAGHTSL